MEGKYLLNKFTMACGQSAAFLVDLSSSPAGIEMQLHALYA